MFRGTFGHGRHCRTCLARYCSNQVVVPFKTKLITGPPRPVLKPKRVAMFEDKTSSSSSVTPDAKQTSPSTIVKKPRSPPRRLPPLPAISDILRLYRVKAKKQMSQNFLLNPRVCDRMIREAKIKEGSRVVEIGPGPGNLTRRILERNPREVYVIEKDRRFLPMLEQLADAASPGQLKIVLGDVMDYTLEGLFPKDEVSKPWNDLDINNNVTFVGNLPFSVSIPLLIRWLRQMSTQSGPFSYGRIPLTLTFQKEVGQRLISNVLSNYRSRIGIMTQTFAFVEYEFTIKGASFYPAPKVDVAVMRITPLINNLMPAGMKFQEYEKFVRTFFHYRRAPISKNLRDLFPRDNDLLFDHYLSLIKMDPTYFPLMIATDEVAEMAGIWFQLCQENPGLIDYDYRARKCPPKILRDMFED